MKKDTHFEVANSDDPKGMAKAVQIAMLNAIQDIFKGMSKETKAPGLTWSQLDWFIEEFKKKDVIIIEQEYET